MVINKSRARGCKISQSQDVLVTYCCVCYEVITVPHTGNVYSDNLLRVHINFRAFSLDGNTINNRKILSREICCIEEEFNSLCFASARGHQIGKSERAFFKFQESGSSRHFNCYFRFKKYIFLDFQNHAHYVTKLTLRFVRELVRELRQWVNTPWLEGG